MIIHLFKIKIFLFYYWNIYCLIDLYTKFTISLSSFAQLSKLPLLKVTSKTNNILQVNITKHKSQFSIC